MYDITTLNDKLVSELRQIAKDLEINDYDELRKQELIYKIVDKQKDASATKSVDNNEETTAGAEKPKRKRSVKAAKEETQSADSSNTAAE